MTQQYYKHLMSMTTGIYRVSQTYDDFNTMSYDLNRSYLYGQLVEPSLVSASE